MTAFPDRTEAAEYYFTYIDLVPAGDVVALLETQARDLRTLLHGIPEARSLFRYAPGKWSIRDVVQHLSDTERLFVSRAFWFARGFDSPLPSFDRHVAVAAARADERQWADVVDEFGAVRSATVAFFRSLPGDAWDRRGIASANPFTVRALAYLAVGHVMHHQAILETRYLA